MKYYKGFNDIIPSPELTDFSVLNRDIIILFETLVIIALIWAN